LRKRDLGGKLQVVLALVGYTRILRINPATPYPRIWEVKTKKMQTTVLGVFSYHSLWMAITSIARAECAAVEDMIKMAACSLRIQMLAGLLSGISRHNCGAHTWR